jgi:hypothetical protein
LTDRDTLTGLLGSWVTVTHPHLPTVWQGRLTGLADNPSLILDGPGGTRTVLPQSYAVHLAATVPATRPEDQPRPFAELRDTGLLWLINRAALHPRGTALALHTDGAGDVTGWSLLRNTDGAPWSFDPATDADGYARAEATLAHLHAQEGTDQ